VIPDYHIKPCCVGESRVDVFNSMLTVKAFPFTLSINKPLYKPLK